MLMGQKMAAGGHFLLAGVDHSHLHVYDLRALAWNCFLFNMKKASVKVG